MSSAPSARALDPSLRAEVAALLAQATAQECTEAPARASRREAFLNSLPVSSVKTRTVQVDFSKAKEPPSDLKKKEESPHGKPEAGKVGAGQKALGAEAAQKEAARWKEKGNAAFGEENYKQAVTYYSKAIEYDGKDPVFWANRAMAQLKLGQMEDVVRDCDQALKLDPAYVKALLRRSTALRALSRLEQAQADLNRVLSLDAANKQAKTDLAAIKAELDKAKANAPAPSAAPSKPTSPSSSAAPSAASLSKPAAASDSTPAATPTKSSPAPPVAATTQSPAPSEIPQKPSVAPHPSPKPSDSPAPASSSPAPKPAAPTPAASSPAKTSSPSPASPPTEPKEEVAMVASPSKKLSDKDKKLTQIIEDEKARISSLQPSFAPPANFIEFERHWVNLYTDDARYVLFSSVPPKSMGKLLAAAPGTEFFTTLVLLLESHFLRDGKLEAVADILRSVSKMPNVDLLGMFLSDSEKGALTRVLLAAASTLGPADAASIRKAFSLA